MAVYGRDFYGYSRYGRATKIEFGIEPFTARPVGYGSLLVSWNSPAGEWQEFRLIRNRHGFAAFEDDGEVLITVEANGDSPITSTSYHDSGLVAGGWYYYTVFIRSSNQWHRAGTTSGISLRETGITQVIWERIPKYFRYRRRAGAAVTDSHFFNAHVINPDLLDKVNNDLLQFVQLLGWGVDYLRNHQETLMSAHDPERVGLREFDALAQQLGVRYSDEVPLRFARSHVANASLLADQRGTLNGLEEIVSLTTGWSVDVDLSPNLFLSQDQASFVNPVYEEWNPGKNYPSGHRVQHAGRIMQCIAGAYGNSQRPPVTSEGTWNAYWVLVQNLAEAEASNPPEQGGGVSSWVAYKESDDSYAGPVLALGVGVGTDPDDQLSHSLRIDKTGSAPATFRLVGALRRV